jgi:hypothetical protein
MSLLDDLLAEGFSNARLWEGEWSGYVKVDLGEGYAGVVVRMRPEKIHGHSLFFVQNNFRCLEPGS